MSDGITVLVDNLAREVTVAVGIQGPPGASSSSLDQLTNVTITSPVNGEVLTYQSGEWVNAAGATVDLSNYYTKSQTDSLLAAKAALVHNHVVADITNFTSANVQGGTF